MHFKVTSFRSIVGQFPEVLVSEDVLRSFSYTYPVN